jgi:hypothetical protein
MSKPVFERVGMSVLALLGIAIVWQATRIESPWRGDWLNNIAFWPAVLGGVMAFAALLVIVAPPSGGRLTFSGIAPSALVSGFMLVWVWTLPWTGFFTGSFLFLVLVAVISGERRPAPLVAQALVNVCVAYVLFWPIMHIRLPIGWLDQRLGLTMLFR